MTVQVIAKSTITCPSCGTSKTETMPTDAGLWLAVLHVQPMQQRD
jgi:hypothetical protein